MLGMNTSSRRAAASAQRLAANAAVLCGVLALAGCSAYGIGIPLLPGLSLNLGATSAGGYSVGLGTGFGPLGAGFAVNQDGLVAGNAGAGIGAGPLGVGVGTSKVVYDPKAAPVVPPTGVAIGTREVGIGELGSPGNPIAP